jgi:hypothetical protein
MKTSLHYDTPQFNPTEHILEPQELYSTDEWHNANIGTHPPELYRGLNKNLHDRGGATQVIANQSKTSKTTSLSHSHHRRVCQRETRHKISEEDAITFSDQHHIMHLHA